VIVRDNQRQKTFLNDADYEAYLERLSRYRRRYGYTVHAYCLMPDHPGGIVGATGGSDRGGTEAWTGAGAAQQDSHDVKV
jgi:hypothetical protein